MVHYHPLPCVLTQHQARKLLTGGTVALKRSQAADGGSHTVFLTSQQKSRLEKGNGIRLRFSGVQLRHNAKHGKGLKEYAVKALKAGARKGVDLAKDYAADAASNVAKGALGAIPLVGKPAGKLAEKGIRKVADAVASVVKDKVIGKGIRKRGAGAAKKKGKGLFGSLGSVFQSVGDAGDYVGNKILGNGLYPPGYGGGLLPRPIKGVNSNAAGI